VWSGKFDGDLAAAEVIKIRDDLADQVVRELARPYGIIFNEQASEIEGRPPQSFTSYECVLQFQQYWRRYDAGLYSQVRECLERATIAEPEYADAFASLALIYANAYRFDLDQGTVAFDPRTRALELARRAVDLAPDHARLPGAPPGPLAHERRATESQSGRTRIRAQSQRYRDHG
jgi:adenylate cyclase